MEKIYYVYEWIRLDTNEPFYVEKGKGNRMYSFNRGNNRYFYNIVAKTQVAVCILEQYLTEEEAYQIECYYINKYKYEIGYNLTNVSDGGEGATLVGEKNPMYGRTWWDENTPIEKINKWKMNVRNFGKKNGNYKRPYTLEEKQRMSLAKKGKYVGDKNPNYGNDTLRKKYEANPELKMLNSRKGEINGRTTKIFAYKENILLGEFEYIGKCAEWLIKNNYTKAKRIHSIRTNITKSIKENKKYLGLKFYYKKIA